MSQRKGEAREEYLQRERERSRTSTLPLGLVSATCVGCKAAFEYTRVFRPRLFCFMCRPVEKSVRLCKRCNQPSTSSKHTLCDHCRAMPIKKRTRQNRNYPPGSTRARGYGRDHQAARERWKQKIQAGNVTCARCGGLILPYMKWHLDHSDDRQSYLGPSHEKCNVSAANRSMRRQQGQRQAHRGHPAVALQPLGAHSRDW